MNNEQKCKLIADFEGVEFTRVMPNTRGELYQPDYPNNLNLTMRAARRLPRGTRLIVRSNLSAYIECGMGISRKVLVEKYAGTLSDEHQISAYAAFECLYKFVAAQRKEKP